MQPDGTPSNGARPPQDHDPAANGPAPRPAPARDGRPAHDPACADAKRDVAVKLAASVRAEPRVARLDGHPLPEPDEVRRLTRDLVALVFPGYFAFRPSDRRADPTHGLDGPTLTDAVAGLVDSITARLCTQISRALGRGESDWGRDTCSRFMTELPHLRQLISLDVQAAVDGDPACHSPEEAILTMPGVHAIAVHRLAHFLFRAGVPLIPRLMTETAKSATGIDIHPGARIGRSFFVDHGEGVVIGETARIGDHCKIYQGVTLGARSLPADEHGRVKREPKRHPTLEDHVTVYANATLLGGDTVIGAGCVIGGGVFLMESVPAGQRVFNPKPDTKLRQNPERPPANFQI